MYKARVTQRPGVVVGNYKVVRASRPVIKPVTEEQVDGIIADLAGMAADADSEWNY